MRILFYNLISYKVITYSECLHFSVLFTLYCLISSFCMGLCALSKSYQVSLRRKMRNFWTNRSLISLKARLTKANHLRISLCRRLRRVRLMPVFCFVVPLFLLKIIYSQQRTFYAKKAFEYYPVSDLFLGFYSCK